MKKIVYILIPLLLITLAIANIDLNTSSMQPVKETHFQKHIEFWTIFITLSLVGIYYLLKKRYK